MEFCLAQPDLWDSGSEFLVVVATIFARDIE